MTDLVLKPKKWKPILALIANLFFVFLGYHLVFEQHNNFGWFTLSFFGMGAILSIAQLLPLGNRLVIHNDGITVDNLFWKSRLNWKDIEQFYTKKILFQNLVMIRFSKSYSGKYLGYKINHILSKNE
jgi:hypothetical protein